MKKMSKFDLTYIAAFPIYMLVYFLAQQYIEINHAKHDMLIYIGCFVVIYICKEVLKPHVGLVRLNTKLGRIFPSFRVLAPDKKSLPAARAADAELLIARWSGKENVNCAEIVLTTPLDRMPTKEEIMALVTSSRSGGFLFIGVNGKISRIRMTRKQVAILQTAWVWP